MEDSIPNKKQLYVKKKMGNMYTLAQFMGGGGGSEQNQL